MRITTRVRENDLGDALFSTLHEAGHAMYEQAVDPALAATPLGHGVSAGVHESQSRLWEKIWGAAAASGPIFIRGCRAALLSARGRAAPDLSPRHQQGGAFVIRTDADEVTYNLHIMLRFDSS